MLYVPCRIFESGQKDQGKIIVEKQSCPVLRDSGERYLPESELCLEDDSAVRGILSFSLGSCHEQYGNKQQDGGFNAFSGCGSICLSCVQGNWKK